MDTLFENFTVSILKLNKLVQKIKQYETEKYGLKAIHVTCLYYLKRSAAGLTSGELVKLTLDDKAAISRAISLLSEKGYATYDSAKYNSPIKLTAEGRRVADELDRKIDSAVSGGRDSEMTDAQREAFYSTLNRIGKNLESYYFGLIGTTL